VVCAKTAACGSKGSHPSPPPSPRSTGKREVAVLILTLLCIIAPICARAAEGPTKVSFRSDGIALVNGKPFFPIAIWMYELNVPFMADLHEQRFNTIIGNGFHPDQLNFIHDNGMMFVPFSTDEFVKAAKDHPGLLAWYLQDEPEGKHKPDDVRKAYEHLKAKDPNHPIGLDHYLFEALTQFKDGCDFTMTDVYPILANRDGIIANVGVFTDEARRIHGANWPHWCFIQDFGGPDTDGGKWAQPLPHEVRCMVFIALAHRANGILYFSYWPKAPDTWRSIGKLNRDLYRLMPWLTAEGSEAPASCADNVIHVRAKKVGNGWMVIAVNTDRKFYDTTITVEAVGDASLRMPFENRAFKSNAGKWKEKFAPFEEKVYLVGPEPQD
jgi:hypothetical protein